MDLARSTSDRGEVVLQRHEDGAVELRVNGIFVMDDRSSRREELLAEAALRDKPRRLLVGGLGLGFTVRTLTACPEVERITVAEIEPALVGWMRAGIIPSVLDDERVEVRLGDVRETVAQAPPASYDAILLDVDNGPDYLVYDANAAVYRPDFLATCGRALEPGGILTIWSSTQSAALAAALDTVFGSHRLRPVAVDLQGRDERYYLYAATTH